MSTSPNTGTAKYERTAVAEYFKEVIYGGIDGIITTFAVVAGFSGAAMATDTTTQLSFMVVLLFGLANLFADGISMGLGSYLSTRSEQDLYVEARQQEVMEVRNHPDQEYADTIKILMARGFSDTDAETIATCYRKNEEYWVDFMMNHELQLPDVREDNPYLNGFITFVSFVFFGAIPLLPFMISTSGDPLIVFYYSASGTFLALIALGLLKWKIVGSRLISSLLEVTVVGGAAAVIAYYVGTLFTL